MLVGLDFMAATGLTKAEYMYWIAAINVGWEATTGTPESLARCFRAAGFHNVEFIDTAHLEGIPQIERPMNQFLEKHSKQQMLEKYGSLFGQLNPASFVERDRHLYA